MTQPYIFNFKGDISGIEIPEKINNPFCSAIPKIAQQAAREFQVFIQEESIKWQHNFDLHKGKMFGVLIVQTSKLELGFLGTVSGKLFGNEKCNQFAPPIFDESTDDYFINKGMLSLAEMSNQIKASRSDSEKLLLIEKRKQHSNALQKRLFENYTFSSVSGARKNIIDIFRVANNNYPPSAAGECAAPKLLQCALSNNLRPIAIAEFWWDTNTNRKKKKHLGFYPACRDKCKPILEFMLNDFTLYEKAKGLPN